jgi:hypothetical protein
MNETPQIGDIFVNSWGYDQTNVDAYQVTRLTPKKMELAPINTAPVPGTDGFMCSKVVPVKDSFQLNGRKFLVRQSDAFVLNYGYCKKHQDGRTYYCSWYA